MPKERKDDLGELLKGFLKLYGFDFNYHRIGISVRDGGSYFTKISRGWVDYQQPWLLSAEDPGAPENDASKCSFGIMEVREAFANAYHVLMQKEDMHPEYEEEESSSSSNGKMSSTSSSSSSILTRILLRDLEMDTHRQYIQRIYTNAQFNNRKKEWAVSTSTSSSASSSSSAQSPRSNNNSNSNSSSGGGSGSSNNSSNSKENLIWRKGSNNDRFSHDRSNDRSDREYRPSQGDNRRKGGGGGGGGGGYRGGNGGGGDRGGGDRGRNNNNSKDLDPRKRQRGEPEVNEVIDHSQRKMRNRPKTPVGNKNS